MRRLNLPTEGDRDEPEAPKHTPGPWSVRDDGCSEVAVWREQLPGEPDYIIREVCSLGRYPGEPRNNLGLPEDDAHLIAAAPTMWDLLERAATMFEHHGPDEDWWGEWLQIRHPGEHFILTDEGWEPGESLATYREDEPDWEPHDEIGRPAGADGEVNRG